MEESKNKNKKNITKWGILLIVAILIILVVRHVIIFNNVVSDYESYDTYSKTYGKLLENSLYIDQKLEYDEYSSSTYLIDSLYNQLIDISIETSEAMQSNIEGYSGIHINVVIRGVDGDKTIFEVKNGELTYNIKDDN